MPQTCEKEKSVAMLATSYACDELTFCNLGMQ